jgi:hypothetical protein
MLGFLKNLGYYYTLHLANVWNEKGSMVKNFIIVLFLSLFFVLPAQATLVKPPNVDQLANLSKFIFKAKVIAKNTELDLEESHKIVTYYTVEVLEWVKGNSWTGTDTLVFKQLANGNFEVDGRMVNQQIYFPQYDINETWLFFLPNPHWKSGLVAPLALQYGAYKVSVDTNGQESLPALEHRAQYLQKNLGSNNKAKFLSSQISANDKEGDQSYNSFKSLIESAMETNQ